MNLLAPTLPQPPYWRDIQRIRVQLSGPADLSFISLRPVGDACGLAHKSGTTLDWPLPIPPFLPLAHITKTYMSEDD